MRFAWQEARSYLGFGLYRVGAMVANAISSRIDQLIVGILLGAETLGYYNVAIRIVFQPIERINPAVTRVTFPAFSRIQDDVERLSINYARMLRFLAILNAPILLGIAVAAQWLVPVMLGDQWLPCIPVIQVLCFYTLLRSMVNAGGSLILARGKAHWTMFWNLGVLLVYPVALWWAGSSGDIMAICWTLLVLQAVLTLFYHRVFIRSLTNVPLRRFIWAFGKPIILASLMAFAVAANSHLFRLEHDVQNLIVAILSGVIVYLMLAWFVLKDEQQILRSVWSKQRQ